MIQKPGKNSVGNAANRTSGSAAKKSSKKTKRDIFEEREYQEKRKKAFLFGGFGITAAGIVTAFVLVLPGAMNPGLNTENVEGSTATTTSPLPKPEPLVTYAEGEGGVDPLTEKAEFWEKDGKLYPNKIDKRLLEYYDADKVIEGIGKTDSGDVNADGTPASTNADGTTIAGSKNSDGSDATTGVIDQTGEVGYVEYDVFTEMAQEIYGEAGLVSASQTLPSEAAGFTSDDSKAKLADGTFNTMYSYWTAENFQAAVGVFLSRLTSPEYGGWASYQFSNTNASKTFRSFFIEDMFTQEYLTANEGKPYKDWVPIYADWDSNDYGLGDVLLPGGSRWFGDVTSTEANFVYNEETSQYTVNMTLGLKYTAWDKDKNKLERTGTMTLELVPNTGANRKDNGFKVLINNASLKVDG